MALCPNSDSDEFLFDCPYMYFGQSLVEAVDAECQLPILPNLKGDISYIPEIFRAAELLKIGKIELYYNVAASSVIGARDWSYYILIAAVFRMNDYEDRQFVSIRTKRIALTDLHLELCNIKTLLWWSWVGGELPIGVTSIEKKTHFVFLDEFKLSRKKHYIVRRSYCGAQAGSDFPNGFEEKLDYKNDAGYKRLLIEVHQRIKLRENEIKSEFGTNLRNETGFREATKIGQKMQELDLKFSLLQAFAQYLFPEQWADLTSTIFKFFNNNSANLSRADIYVYLQGPNESYVGDTLIKKETIDVFKRYMRELFSTSKGYSRLHSLDDLQTALLAALKAYPIFADTNKFQDALEGFYENVAQFEKKVDLWKEIINHLKYCPDKLSSEVLFNLMSVNSHGVLPRLSEIPKSSTRTEKNAAQNQCEQQQAAQQTAEVQQTELDYLAVDLFKLLARPVVPIASDIHRGLNFQSIRGDGHCAYRAIDVYVNQGYQVLRNLAAEQIAADIDLQELSLARHDANEQAKMEQDSGYRPKPFDLAAYLHGVRTNYNVWADHIEITALMRALNRAIIVVGHDGLIINTDAKDFHLDKNPIFIYYNGVNHYEALPSKNDPRYPLKTILADLCARQPRMENQHPKQDSPASTEQSKAMPSASLKPQ